MNDADRTPDDVRKWLADIDGGLLVTDHRATNLMHPTQTSPTSWTGTER